MRNLCLIMVFLLTADAASAFVRSRTEADIPLAWGQQCIPIYLHESGSDDLSFEAVQATIGLSLEAWNGVSCSDQAVVYQGTTPDLRVGYDQRGSNYNQIIFQEEQADWPHPNNVVGLTTVTFCHEVGGACSFAGEILDADIEINGVHFNLSVGDPVANGHFDLMNTVVHELGHVLGFDHTPDENATMYAEAPPGDTAKRDLAQDDIDALCEVYPNVDEPDDCSSVDFGTYMGGGTNRPAISGESGCRVALHQGRRSPGLLVFFFVAFALFRRSGPGA